MVNLRRKRDHVVKFELDDYQPFEMTVRRDVSAWVYADVIFGGIIGLAVDEISGGMYKFTPNTISTNLSPSSLGLVHDGDVSAVSLLSTHHHN